MRLMIFLFFFFLLSPLAGVRANPAQKDLARSVQTSVNFSDLLVQGKYSLSGEAVVTVEADKVLDSLLLTKKDFNKKIKRSAHRRQDED